MITSKSILITGGAGFIGSNLAQHFLNQNYKVIIFDNFQTGKLINIQNLTNASDLKIIEGNINYQPHLRELYKYPVDYIYHYAASVGVERTLLNPLEVLDDIDGIRNILEFAREKCVKQILYSSSSEVYGESVSFPQNENSTPLNSKLPYAAVKNLGEIYLRTYNKEFGIPYTIFRFFNTYGPKQSPHFVVSKFIKQALNNEPLTIYGDGTQTRSFIYIDDNIQATSNALLSDKSVNKTINIGNPEEISILKLAEIIIQITNSKSAIKFLPKLKEGDMPRRVPDTVLMKELLDIKTTTPFNDGLFSTVEYFAKSLKTQ